jgi:hypothetical protein
MPPAQYAAPPPQRKGGLTWLWVLLGCGCLLLIIALVGAIWGGSWLYQKQKAEIEKFQKEFEQKTDQPTTPDGAPKTDERTSDDEPATDEGKTEGGSSESDESPGSSGAQPGETAAKVKALAQCDEGWVAKVMSHSDDWTKVTVAVGPPASEWVGEMDLKWTGEEYVITESRGE